MNGVPTASGITTTGFSAALEPASAGLLQLAPCFSVGPWSLGLALILAFAGRSQPIAASDAPAG